MILKDILEKYSFNVIFTELCDMIPVLNRKRPDMQEAYDFLIAQSPVTSKKKIVYIAYNIFSFLSLFSMKMLSL